MEATKTQRLLLDHVSNHKYLISIIGFVIALAAVFYTVYEMTKHSVTVSIDGNEEIITTHAETVADLFAEEDWNPTQHDVIEPSLDTALMNDTEIQWKQAKEVQVEIGGESKTVWTTANDVSELLEELSVTYKEQDELNLSLDTEITHNMSVHYQPANLITLISDGETRDIWTTSTTVADFLDKEQVELGDLDRVEPVLEESLDKDTDVQVTRVEKVTDVVEEELSFETVTKDDGSIDKGKEQVLEDGEAGLVKNVYEIILEDGEEVSRELLEKETVKDSVDRVVAVGTKEQNVAVANEELPEREEKTNTKIASEVTTAPEPETKNEKSFTMTATAYTAGCAGCSGVTATGIDLNSNRNMKVVAVDPSVIPLGSKVHVEGYGTAIAGDTGGAINGNKIDLHVPTTAEAQRFGRKQVKVTIVE